MTPMSAPLAHLPMLDDGSPVFLPILGRGPDGAARFLRGVAQDGQPTSTTTEALRMARLLGGVATTLHKTLNLVVFPHNTAVFGVIQGAKTRFYPQPLFAPLGSATHATLAKNADLVGALAQAVRLSPPVARSAEAALMGGHLWPTWATLDLTGMAVARKSRIPATEADTLVYNLIHALPAPVCPPQWRSLERIDVVVRGRLITLDGFTTPTAQIKDGPVLANNTAWTERLCAGLSALFADTTLFPAWTCMRQSEGGTGTDPIGPGHIWHRVVPLKHDGMSSHERMRCAASLPPSVLAAW